MGIKLGYFVPEFPGQTHIFFWRELERLEALGAKVDIVSTRKPPLKISSHSWSDKAKARTIYLLGGELNFLLLLKLLGCALQFSPLRWIHCLRSIQKSGLPLKGKVELLGLAFFGAALSLIAKDKGWDHLHVHSAANAANIALFAKILSGLPYSLTLHGPLSDYGPNQKEKWSHADFGIVITQKLFGEIRSELGEAATKKLYIAPMGVNLQVFKRKAPYEAYQGQGVGRIYCVGRLNPCKGHADLIRAVALLRDKGQRVELNIAGEDELGGSGYHLELQALIDELNINREVKLLGAVSEQVIRDGLIESHLFALASLGEPLGVAIMEAMALEMPVVVTSGGGVKELVDADQDGVLVEAEDVASISAGLEKVLNNPALANRLGSASRKKIAAQFQDSRSAELLLKHAKKRL
ncbi:MAG: colanic acid biosynthesis glycosyltransferase WcaL [Proteobacteria bacterium]|nr:MAG: colanic acid biosynthesis glycosyltransferase WcaL [Pseudomonadota bacterium]